MTPTSAAPRHASVRRTLRTLRTLAVVTLLAGATAGGTFALARHTSSADPTTAPAFATAQVTAGNLTTTEKIDGSLELSSSLAVLHRIEGQTSVASTGAAATTGGAAPTSGAGAGAGAGAGSFTAAAVQAAIIDIDAAVPPPCPDPGSLPPPNDGASTTTTIVPSGPPVCTPAAAPTTTTPATTTPATTAPPFPAAPTTTSPGAPPASTPDASTTSTTSDPADGSTATSSVPGGGGGSAPTGGRVPTGAAPGGTSAVGGGGSATSSRVTQIVTSVIADGATVGLGDVLYSVESQPVVALSGALPAWRTLSTSSSDGPDVHQLESSLVSLGYDPAGTVVVDDTFDARTKAMVKRWQTGLGVTATGTVKLGSVVFLPTTTTVGSVTARVGDAVGDGSTIVTLTAPTQRVIIDVPDGDEAFIVPGLAVTIGNDGGSGIVGLLRSIERDGAVVVQAVIVPDAPLDGVENGATVKVTVTTDALDDVLIAPAQALLSHLDGSYAVQVRADDGTTTWRTVELLGVSGSKVAIRGDGIAAGTTLLVPA